MTTQPLEKVVVKTERRHSQRKKFRGMLEIEWGSTMLSGVVRDIGPGGLFVEVSPQLWVGATFRARLMVKPVLALECKVVRVEPGAGVAVVFEIPEEAGQAQLEKFLMGLPPA